MQTPSFDLDCPRTKYTHHRPTSTEDTGKSCGYSSSAFNGPSSHPPPSTLNPLKALSAEAQTSRVQWMDVMGLGRDDQTSRQRQQQQQRSVRAIVKIDVKTPT